MVSTSALADISASTTIKEVRPLGSGTNIIVGVEPVSVCGTTKNAFTIADADTANGKAIYAAALTALAAGLNVKAQVDAPNCGQTWPTLFGLLILSS